MIKMLPNERLRQERQRRGWSRQYVAEQIGVADPKTIGRWERGVAFPSSYFLHRLCSLFGMLAQDLGLFPGEHDDALQTGAVQHMFHRASVFSFSTSPLYDPAIPQMLVDTGGLVGRDKLLEQLKRCLCAGKRLNISALHGLPGVGKTALARELIYENDIQQYFGDGILWVGLGLWPNLSGLLGRWASLLGIPATEMALLKGEEERARAIHDVIGTRRMLLVIDDAWRIEEASAFKVGGPNCAYLLTTRIPSVALHFANGEAIVVRELDGEDSLDLLARLTPDVVTNESSTARALVQCAGGLPLALVLMGRYLQSQAYSGQPRRLRAALERLRCAEERLRLTMQQAPFEYLASSSLQTLLSLQAVIETSVRQLDEATRRVLSMLSAFPAKPNSFSEEAALVVSDAPLELLDELIDAGFLESAGPGRYTLHQTIVDYASIREYNSAAYERMVEYFINFVEVHETDYETLDREASNVLAALQVAFERGMSTFLIRGAIHFTVFLKAQRWYELAESHLKRAEQAARSLDDVASLARILYHQEEITSLRKEAVCTAG
jgi:transcriptional regulator with XRE-family HTH domain/DNA polymerase III delta prime subunit